MLDLLLLSTSTPHISLELKRSASIYDTCRFDKKSQAEAAITGMNGVVPEGGTEPLVVKVAEEHGKMKAAYYAGYHAGINNLRGGGAGESNTSTNTLFFVRCERFSLTLFLDFT